MAGRAGIRTHGTGRLGTGKIPIAILERTVFGKSGARSKDVLVGSRAGVDFGAVKMGDRFLLSSSDPVTGVSPKIGTYAVNVNANDVATSGNRPRYLESVILLPEGSDGGLLKTIAEDIHRTSLGLGISVIGGHTEVTPGLRTPIVVMTAFAVARKFVSSAMASPGDSIVMTKSAGIEGTAVLSGTLRAADGVGRRVLGRAEKFLDKMSVVDEAVAAYESGFVGAMHDCTEGGVLGAVFEMALASGVGFELERDAIPVAPETKEVCRALRVDPIKLIGSGSLLLAVKRGKEAEVKEALDGVCEATVVGRFTNTGRVLWDKRGRKAVEEAPQDELWRVLARGTRSEKRD